MAQIVSSEIVSCNEDLIDSDPVQPKHVTCTLRNGKPYEIDTPRDFFERFQIRSTLRDKHPPLFQTSAHHLELQSLILLKIQFTWKPQSPHYSAEGQPTVHVQQRAIVCVLYASMILYSVVPTEHQLVLNPIDLNLSGNKKNVLIQGTWDHGGQRTSPGHVRHGRTSRDCQTAHSPPDQDDDVEMRKKK